VGCGLVWVRVVFFKRAKRGLERSETLPFSTHNPQPTTLH
jgi:hypothetical protein